jgi:serine/threonine-protein kinase
MDQLRRFRMGCCVGRGGFGEVYQAEMASPSGLTRTIAVKLLRREVGADAEALRRLRDEARLLACIRHPVVVRGFDLVRLDGRIGLVTEFVEGEDLLTCLRGEHRLPLRPLLQVIAELASGLSAAWSTTGEHGRPLRIVHRDVKPTNVRIGRHGVVKLLDFGIARFSDADREARTDSDVVIGSVPYMAPERFVAKAATSPAADVYGLGCLLYEGLAGERFHEDGKIHVVSAMAVDPGRAAAHLEERFTHLPPLAPAVVDILKACVAHDPSARPGPAELAAEMASLAESAVGPTLREWCRDHPWRAGPPRAATLEGRVLVESPLVLDEPTEARPRKLVPPRIVREPRPTLDPNALAAKSSLGRMQAEAIEVGVVAGAVAAGCFVIGMVGAGVALAVTIAGIAVASGAGS